MFKSFESRGVRSCFLASGLRGADTRLKQFN